MPKRWHSRSIMRLILILLSAGVMSNVPALLIVPTALNGNHLTPSLAAAPNELGFAVRFEQLTELRFDVLIESHDDPFTPIAVMGLIENLTVHPWGALTMSLGGGATLTEIGNPIPQSLVTAFSRDTVAGFSFDPPFAPNAAGVFGDSVPWLINTHGARTFSIGLRPSLPPEAATVPEPATAALFILGCLLIRYRPRRLLARTRD